MIATGHIITEQDIAARAFDLMEDGQTYDADRFAQLRADALAALIAEGGIFVEVTRTDSKLYSVIVVGGTAREQREVARAKFAELGVEMGDGFAVRRPHGLGMLYGQAR